MIKEANIVEEATIKKYEEYKESCYKKYSTNENSFANCFKEKAKKINDLIELMEYKKYYFIYKISNCLSAKNSVEKCTS